jgi:hypothetical protein
VRKPVSEDPHQRYLLIAPMPCLQCPKTVRVQLEPEVILKIPVIPNWYAKIPVPVLDAVWTHFDNLEKEFINNK